MVHIECIPLESCGAVCTIWPISNVQVVAPDQVTLHIPLPHNVVTGDRSEP